MFIKVGYAYLSKNLGMGGLALAPKNTWDVHFVNNSIVESENLDSCLGGDTCSRVTQHATIGQDGVSVSFGVEFHVIGDYYEFTVDVINNGSIDAMLNEIIKEGISGNSDYLDFTVTYSDGMPIAQYDQLLKDGGTEKIKVKVTFIGTPEDDVNANLSVTVSYVQADSSTNSRSYDPETMIRSLNTLGTSIADDDPDNNLRFIGANPDNYVWFNNQKWRIIGVFDGRLKLIQDSIGNYAWDVSKGNVNDGWGVNQWGPNDSGYTGAAIMKLVNPGYETNIDFKCKTKANWVFTSIDCGNNKDSDYTTGLVNNSLYWNASSGTCYIFGNYDVGSCDFTSTGLSDAKSKNMIDDVTWYLGTNDAATNPFNDGTATASLLYNMERSNYNGKQCSESSQCSDTVDRTIRWQGKVGLMYPSDFAYATGGGNTYSRSDCLGYSIGSNNSYQNWKNTYTECFSNDWLYDDSVLTWTITPGAMTYTSSTVLHVDSAGFINPHALAHDYAVRPTVYLKPGVVFTNEGDGKQATPFVLRDLSNTNTVTFDVNGGGTIPSTTRQVNGGDSVGTLPTPTAQDGMKFDGWFTSITGGSKVSRSYIPAASVTVYAHWTPVYDPETRIRSLNTIGISIADDDPDNNLRFIGANPNNYVSFNNQKWRIIGVFDGKLKLVQESIGSYSWSVSKANINNGWGVNQWGPNDSGYTGAPIMKLLNPGYENDTDFKCKKETVWHFASISCGSDTDSDYTTGLVNNSLYWNASSGKCYTFGNYNVEDCDFTSTGLKDVKSKNMIDDAMWYLGTVDVANNTFTAGTYNASIAYNAEHSNYNGKQCASGAFCADTVARTTRWQGKVGLIYVSDYAYATGGGNTYSRNDCLNSYIGESKSINWSSNYVECSNNDWLLNKNEGTWTISPSSSSSMSMIVFSINNTGNIQSNIAAHHNSIRPTIYLKTNVKFIGAGTGTKSNPFVLELMD
ncbi:MAG: InlB B-repeat-containing protein [Bacilli bacterium]|nr:InlB B-repeat-containing protein [Bacilli bacterium]